MATNLIIDVSVVIAAVSPSEPDTSKRVNSCSAPTARMRRSMSRRNFCSNFTPS